MTEPRPLGIDPHDLGIGIPSWIQAAHAEYQPTPVAHVSTETDILRGGPIIKVIDRILPTVNHAPRVLLVGLGYDNEPLMGCVEPFKVAAHLEGRGIDYRMTLVDIVPDVIADVRNKTTVYVSARQYSGEVLESMDREWNKYLSDTKQAGRILFENEPGMQFYDYLLNSPPDAYMTAELYLKRGVYAASVSPQFRTKLASGEIKLVEGDIAKADIGDPEGYDAVELTNVLYLMPRAGQQLALGNVARNTRQGGLILLNDIGGYSGTPVFPRLGGWLDDKKMDDLQLTVEEVLFSKNTSETVILKKK